MNSYSQDDNNTTFAFGDIDMTEFINTKCETITSALIYKIQALWNSACHRAMVLGYGYRLHVCTYLVDTWIAYFQSMLVNRWISPWIYWNTIQAYTTIICMHIISRGPDKTLPLIPFLSILRELSSKTKSLPGDFGPTQELNTPPKKTNLTGLEQLGLCNSQRGSLILS